MANIFTIILFRGGFLMREVRDPVHGFIYRSSLEQELIDTPVMQRLRRIKQLAMAYLVYPGALHTRFDHSLGVFCLADKLTNKLFGGKDAEERRALKLAALLHDVGHGPFSHVSESIVDKFYDKEKVHLKEDEKVHERITIGIIKHNPTLQRLLSAREIEEVTGILEGTRGEPLFRNIISGPLDVDKQDYLLRDSYFCGVKYGVFDIDRMLDILIKMDENKNQLLAVSEDGVHTLEQFVLAKYYMTSQVYRHKVRLVTDAMIIRAIELGITEDKIDYLKKLYTFDGTDDFYKEWVKWDDEMLNVMVCSDYTPNGYAKEIFRALRERRLFKRVYSENLNQFSAVSRNEIVQNFVSHRANLEKNIGDYLNVDSLKVIANSFKVQSVRMHSKNEEEPIMVHSSSTVPKSFEDESTLFRSINEAEKDEFIEIYAPVEFADEADKRKKLREYSKHIHRMIENTFNPEGLKRGGKR